MLFVVRNPGQDAALRSTHAAFSRFRTKSFPLASVGIVHSGPLLKGWRFAIVGIAVMAAAITPTVDPVNMSLLMLPMIVLYGLGILLAAIAERARKRRVARTELAEASPQPEPAAQP